MNLISVTFDIAVGMLNRFPIKVGTYLMLDKVTVTVIPVEFFSFRFYFELLKFYKLFSFNIYLFLFCDNFNLKGRYFFSQRLKRKFKEYVSNE